MSQESEIPQNPMQPQIQGYPKFDENTSRRINTIKELGNQIEVLLLESEVNGNADPRMMALARTNLQQGAMWWIRALAKPEGLF